MLIESLIQLSADGGAVLLPCSLAWGRPVTVCTAGCRLYGRGNGDLRQEGCGQQAAPPGAAAASAPERTARRCQRLTHSQASLAQALGGLLPLSPESWGTQGFASFPSPLTFCNHIPLTSRSDSLGSQSLCWIARLGSLLWPLELFQQCLNLFGIIVLQFVDHPPGGSTVGV